MNGLPHPIASPGRVEPRVNIMTVGHTGHGKTTLTAAITKALHDRMPDLNPCPPFGVIDNPPQKKVRDVPIAIARTEYRTGARHYTHVDLPQSRRLRQAHDRQYGSDRRRDPGGVGAG